MQRPQGTDKLELFTRLEKGGVVGEEGAREGNEVGELDGMVPVGPGGHKFAGWKGS